MVLGTAWTDALEIGRHQVGLAELGEANAVRGLSQFAFLGHVCRMGRPVCTVSTIKRYSIVHEDRDGRRPA